MANYVDPALSVQAMTAATDHAGLVNLDYVNAGHTGFQATMSGGTGIAVAADSISLEVVGTVTPGSYVYASITVDQYGRVTAVADGTAPASPTAASIRALGFFDVTNDGAGSGLDADLLDGLSSAAFQPAGSYPTGSGTSTGTNTGDNAVNSLYSGLVSNATHTGEVTGATALTIDKTITPTWTGVHTYSATPVFNAGISLGTSGVLTLATADSPTVPALDHVDTATRTQGFNERSYNSVSGNITKITSWDGRVAFGYQASLAPQAGHRLAFLDDDTSMPTGAPVYVGILSSVLHSNTAQTVTRLIGLVGSANVSTATGLSAVVVNGLTGHVSSSADSSFTGKVLACFSGALSQGNSVATAEPLTKDITFAKSSHPKGAYDHLTVLWCPNFSLASATGYPTNLPGLSSSVRATIQDWGASISSGAAAGEYWAVRGEHINGAVATFPAHTGYLRMVYPRRTGGTGVHATHAWWEPWPNTTTIRGGALKGDTYFDDGTNFAAGLWQYTTAWERVITQVAAPSAYTLTNVTTDRSYDANATTIDELADALGTLIADLQARGMVG